MDGDAEPTGRGRNELWRGGTGNRTTCAGFVNGDTAALLTTPPTCWTSASSSSVPGTYPATCSGAEDDNYDVS